MTDFAATDDDTRCMRGDCGSVALEWWWIEVEGMRRFRCYCLTHADDERSSDLAAFGPARYVPGSDANDDHA